MRPLIWVLLIAACVTLRSSTLHVQVRSSVSPTLADAGSYGLVRVRTTSQVSGVFPSDCLTSDGNKAFRPDKTFTVDPSDPTHLYIGIEFLGFFISNDSGVTWRRSSSGIIGYPRSDDVTKPCLQEMGDLTLDAQDPRHLLLLVIAQPGYITNYEDENRGVYESRDGGVTWHQLITQPGINIATHDGVKFAPSDPRVIYSGTSTSARLSNSPDDPGRVFSTVGVLNGSRDGGATWQELPTGFLSDVGVVEISVSRTDPLTATAFTFGRVHDPSGDPNLTTFGPGLGVIKTSNGGATWTRLDSGNSASNSVSVADLMPSHVFRINFDLRSEFSTDGGATFQPANLGFPPPNLRAVKMSQYDPAGLLGLGGDDSGAVFTITNGSNVTRAGQVAASPQLATTRFQKFEFGPDGAWYASGYYTGTVNGAFKQECFVFRSRDSGATWTRILNSATMAGPTTLFSDDPLTAGTRIKAAHLTELRSYVDELRNRFSLAPYSWTSPAITAGSTTINAVHLTELRQALDQVYVAAGRTPPSYLSVVTPGALITTAALTELRAAITAIY